MFLLKLSSELQDLIKKIHFSLKIQAIRRLNFHQMEFFYKEECKEDSSFAHSLRPIIVRQPKNVLVEQDQKSFNTLNKACLMICLKDI